MTRIRPRALGSAFRPAVLALLGSLIAAGPASAQTTYTWTGPDSGDFLTAGNWTPSAPSPPPGDPGSTANTDVALFASAGTTIAAATDSYSLGAIATAAGATGGPVTVNFSQNGTLRLNGGTGAFATVVAEARGRDLIITTTMRTDFGTAGQPSTFFVDAGRVLAINNTTGQQITNQGGNVIKEGAGTLFWGGTGTGLQRDLGSGTSVSINGGTLAAKGNLASAVQMNVAAGATLQAGISPGENFNVANSTVTFASGSQLKVVTDGTSVSQLQNANVTKGATDPFQIVLTGLNPTGTVDYNPNGIIIQGPHNLDLGTWTNTTPGEFSVVGDGFTVTAWSLTVSNNQVQLNSFTVTPVPEPTAALAVAAVGGLLLARRRASLRRHAL
jgi:hypothetical protein